MSSTPTPTHYVLFCSGSYNAINVRKAPSLEAEVVKSIPVGDIVKLAVHNADWFKCEQYYVVSHISTTDGAISWRTVYNAYTVDQLKSICSLLGLGKSGKKGQLVKRLAEEVDYSTCTVAQLKDISDILALPQLKLKADLSKRLDLVFKEMLNGTPDKDIDGSSSSTNSSSTTGSVTTDISYTVAQLKAMCELLSLAKSGTKAQLFTRLSEVDYTGLTIAQLKEVSDILVLPETELSNRLTLIFQEPSSDSSSISSNVSVSSAVPITAISDTSSNASTEAYASDGIDALLKLLKTPEVNAIKDRLRVGSSKDNKTESCKVIVDYFESLEPEFDNTLLYFLCQLSDAELQSIAGACGVAANTNTNTDDRLTIFKRCLENSKKASRSSKGKITIPKQLRRQVWIQYNGNTMSGSCYCCSTEIDNDSFHTGHVQAESLGGTLDISNLRPICKSCNSSMGQENMRDYCRKYYPGAKMLVQC